VNLSDGDHFDNLGLYEVVLQRCRHVSRAGADALKIGEVHDALDHLRSAVGPTASLPASNAHHRLTA
jgi:hypothetical protein